MEILAHSKEQRGNEQEKLLWRSYVALATNVKVLCGRFNAA